MECVPDIGAKARADVLVTLLRRKRFNFSRELQLHEGIDQVLTDAKIPFQREVVLTPEDRIDFLCEGVGLEIKVDGSLAAVTRQLWRYADHPLVEVIVLYTTRHHHRDMPKEMKGKPVIVIWANSL